MEKPMKRARKPRVSNTRKSDKEVDDHQNQNSGCSLLELQRRISIEILVRLSPKRILICKCVCKTWRDLISSPEFAKLHLSRGEAFPLIRSLCPSRVSRTLYLVETPELDLMCDSHIKVKLNSKLRIPIRDEELAMEIVEDAGMDPPPKGGVKLSPVDHELKVVNSCDGLLCLSDPTTDDPLVVCNPITGEFINLPDPTPAAKSERNPFPFFRSLINSIDCGLGFSPKTNQYKVVRVFDRQMYQRSTGKKICLRVFEIHTLGTGSWKCVGTAPSSLQSLGLPTYLNGSLHWFYSGSKSSDHIVSFDFDNEKFGSVPPPPFKPGGDNLDVFALGVLRGCLSMCDASGFEKLKVWVMKDYGVHGSWSKEFCFYTMTNEGRWIYGLYEPITLLRNGAILLFHPISGALFYHDPKKPDFKFLKLHGYKSKYEAIAHIPSFISLKDAVNADNLAVENTKSSMCAGFKLQGEIKDLLLVEEDPAMSWY